MSFIINIPGVVFSKPLPKMYRDALCGSSTLACYDALNPVSWPKQDAPALGSPSEDKWTNLKTGIADGLFTRPTLDAIEFSNGFDVEGTVTTRKIQLLDGAIPAVVPTSILAIMWVTHGEQVGTLLKSMFNVGRWVEINYAKDSTTNVAANRFYVKGQGSANREIGIGAPTPGALYQLAAHYDGTGRVMGIFANGAKVAEFAGFADLSAATAGLDLMNTSGLSNTYVGTLHRAFVDTLADGRRAADVVALDYELNSGRFQ